MTISSEKLGNIIDWRSGETHHGAWLHGKALGLCLELKNRNIGPGDKVIISHGGTAHFFADLFGIWKAGACAVCLNANITVEELLNIVEFVKPHAIIHSRLDNLPKDLHSIGLGSKNLAPAEGSPSPSDGCLDDEALILFTSGTTGTPKGVIHTFRSLLARITLNQAYIPYHHRNKTLCILPTHFGHGLIGNCLTPLMEGQDLILAPASNLEVPGSLGAIIDEYEITFMSSVPTFWKRVLSEASPPQKGTLKRVHVGSAPFSQDLWRRVTEWTQIKEVINMYGITETANWLAGACFTKDGNVEGCIGKMWGGQAQIKLEDGSMTAYGHGELCVQSPSLMKGYLQLMNETAAVLQDGWFHTGDIGRIKEDGTMILTGRVGHIINRGGLKIHPEDIDLLLERHNNVAEACAFAIADDVYGELPGVALVLEDSQAFNKSEMRKWCATRLSKEKVPVKWYIVDTIPKTDRGKINRDNVATFCQKMPSE